MLKNNIVRLRKQKGLTQIEFAKALGMSQSAISHWETGRSFPEAPQLFQLADFFKISIDELIGDDDSFYYVPKEKKPKEAPWVPIKENPRPLMLDGGPVKGWLEDRPETQIVAAEVMAEALNNGMTKEETLEFIRYYAQLFPEEKKYIMGSMRFLHSQHDEEKGT